MLGGGVGPIYFREPRYLMQVPDKMRGGMPKCFMDLKISVYHQTCKLHAANMFYAAMLEKSMI